MNELIPIREENGKRAVSARDLHSFVDAETRFDIWIKRTLEYGFSENVDFQCLIKNVQMPNGGFKSVLDDYALTLDCAKEIFMIQRNEKGKQARQYFIEVEKAYRNGGFQIPTSFKEALLLAAEQQDVIEAQGRLLESQKPAVTFMNAVTGTTTNILMRDLAKLITQNGYTIGEIRLYDWLVKNKYLIRTQRWSKKKQRYENDYTPTQKAAELKVFFITEQVITVGESSFIKHTVKITSKGQTYFINKFLSRIAS